MTAYNPLDLKKYYPLVISDLAPNGGIITSNEVTSGERDNVIPPIQESDRTSGVSRYRKIGVKLASATDEVGVIVRNFLLDITSGDKKSYISLGTHRDTQGDLTSPRYFGTGRAVADINVSDTSFDIQFELGAAADLVVQSGDEIHLRDIVTGNKEYLIVNTVVWASDVATITPTATVQKTYLFANNSICASVIKSTNVTTSQENWDDPNTISGIYDEATYPLELNNIGCIEQSLTFTFDDNAGNFTCVSDIKGTLGTGNISNDFSPVNPDFAVSYFILKNAGFSGTWLAGEYFTVDLHPAVVNIWLYYQIPVLSSVSPTAPNQTLITAVDS